MMATTMLFRRQRFHVVGIDATRIAADLVMQFVALRDRPLSCLVKESVCEFSPLADRHPGVAFIVGVTLPEPTARYWVDSVEVGRSRHARTATPVRAKATATGGLRSDPFFLTARFANDRYATDPVSVACPDVCLSLCLRGANPPAESSRGFAGSEIIGLRRPASLTGNGRIGTALAVSGHDKTPLGRASREGGTGPEKAVRRRVMTPPKSRFHLRTLYPGED